MIINFLIIIQEYYAKTKNTYLWNYGNYVGYNQLIYVSTKYTSKIKQCTD